jgi:hypothetical protein
LLHQQDQRQSYCPKHFYWYSWSQQRHEHSDFPKYHKHPTSN